MSNKRTIKRRSTTTAITLGSDLQMARDKQYFLDHPEATSYVRPQIPGEMHGLGVPAHLVVKVTLVAPGIRSRETFDPSTIYGGSLS